MKAHPDRGGTNEAQQRVNIAYEILSDPIQRRQHDIFWRVTATRNSSEQKPREQASERDGRKPAERQAANGGSSLGAFQSRLDAVIKTKKAEVWSQLNSRIELKFNEFKTKYRERKMSALRWGAAAFAGVCLTISWPAFWLAAVVPLIMLGSKSFGDVADKKIGLFENVSDETFRSLAKEYSAQSCYNEAGQFDKYSSYFASILDVALRPSSFDDSETQVARRLAVAFFFSGFIPESYDSQSRILNFADGDERIAVRFRHRSGSAVNISYLKGLIDHMGPRGTVRGMLFCSPGLSGNAADYAAQYGIRWHTLETMNKWIDEMLQGNAIGPKGDLLKSLDVLSQFLARITTSVGYSATRSRYRRRRR